MKRPENGLLGVRTLDWFMVDFPMVVSDASMWPWEGGGLSDGAILPGVVGLEADAMFDDGATPTGTTPLAVSPTVGGDQATIDDGQATVYATLAGGFVFAAASIRFPTTLQGPRANADAQRLVANLIARATAKAAPAEALPAPAAPAPDFSAAATMVQTVAGTGDAGFGDGEATTAQLSAPLGIAVAPDGALIIADAGNHRVRRLDPPESAPRTLTTLAGNGAPPNDGTALAPGAFRHVWGVAVAADGAAWVTDPKGGRVTRIATDGTISVFNDVGAPTGIALAADGTVWLTDLYDGSIRTLAADGTVKVVPTSGGSLSYPTGIALDGDGRAWIVDSGHRQLRRLDADGTFVTIAGGSVQTPFVDGSGDKAALEPLVGIVSVGNRWLVGDAGNYRLRAVTAGQGSADSHVSTFAGAGKRRALTDGDGAHADFVLPSGLAFDGARNIVYAADSGNATIRAISP